MLILSSSTITQVTLKETTAHCERNVVKLLNVRNIMCSLSDIPRQN